MEYQTKTSLILPFHGIWLVSNGGRTPETNSHIRPAEQGPQNQLYAYDFRMENTGKETKLEGAVDPIRVSWSPMSEKTSLLYGGPSAGNHLIIYNLATKNMVNTAELSEFLNSPENKGHVIDHTYSVDVGWFEEDLLVSIQGYGGDFKATPQLYLIDSDTGKVIKRLK